MDFETDLLNTLRASQKIGIDRLARTFDPESDFVDLEVIKFDQGGRLMSNKKCHLPKGSTKL